MTTSALENIRRLAKEAAGSHQSVAMELRIHFANILTTLRKQQGWTQSELARRSGLAESQISELAHADENCTLETVGKVLSALGVRGRLIAVLEHEVDEQIESLVEGNTDGAQKDHFTHSAETARRVTTLSAGATH